MTPTVTIQANFSQDLKIQFIKEAIELYNIQKVSVETAIVENNINVIASHRNECIAILDTVRNIAKIEIQDANNTGTTIVLWY